jgi:hypothetical protein
MVFGFVWFGFDGYSSRAHYARPSGKAAGYDNLLLLERRRRADEFRFHHPQSNKWGFSTVVKTTSRWKQKSY